MTKVLVTGGAGLIGSHIVDLLFQRGYEVRIFDSLEPRTHPHGKPSWVPKEAEFVKGDVRNAEDWERALHRVDVVFHEAFFGGISPDITKMVDVNVGGTAKLFEVVREKGMELKKVVIASTGSVYGEGKYKCAEHGDLHPPLL